MHFILEGYLILEGIRYSKMYFLKKCFHKKTKKNMNIPPWYMPSRRLCAEKGKNYPLLNFMEINYFSILKLNFINHEMFSHHTQKICFCTLESKIVGCHVNGIHVSFYKFNIFWGIYYFLCVNSQKKHEEWSLLLTSKYYGI